MTVHPLLRPAFGFWLLTSAPPQLHEAPTLEVPRLELPSPPVVLVPWVDHERHGLRLIVRIP